MHYMNEKNSIYNGINIMKYIKINLTVDFMEKNIKIFNGIKYRYIHKWETSLSLWMGRQSIKMSIISI